MKAKPHEVCYAILNFLSKILLQTLMNFLPDEFTSESILNEFTYRKSLRS